MISSTLELLITNVYIHACIVDSSCIDNTIRLADSDSYITGRVDLCYNQSWTTLYDASITPEVVTVACRQLGFSDSGIINYCAVSKMIRIIIIVIIVSHI